MKIPRDPPVFSEVFEGDHERALAFFENCSSPDVVAFVQRMNKKYLHWNKMRYQSPPLDMTPQEAWCAVAISRRQQFKEVEVGASDESGENFRYWTPPHQFELIHKIDKMLGGSISSSEVVGIDREQRERYLINSLMEEAIASSQLEGATTTRKNAKKILRKNSAPKNRDEAMIVNNYKAILKVRDFKNRKLSPEMLLELHEILTTGTMDDEADVGRFRVVGDKVRVEDITTGEVFHDPPTAYGMDWRIEEICDFANTKPKLFIHPVIRAIILHFSIGFLHPFIDGNGRTARAVFYWFMLKHDYWLFEFLPISRIFRDAPVQYARAYLHTETDSNDLTYFIDYNLSVINRATNELHAYISKQQAMLSVSMDIIAKHPSLNRRQASLLYYAIRNPNSMLTIKDYQSINNIAYATGRSDIHNLCDLGFLEKIEGGKTHYFRALPDLPSRLKVSQPQESRDTFPQSDKETVLSQLRLF